MFNALKILVAGGSILALLAVASESGEARDVDQSASARVTKKKQAAKLKTPTAKLKPKAPTSKPKPKAPAVKPKPKPKAPTAKPRPKPQPKPKAPTGQPKPRPGPPAPPPPALVGGQPSEFEAAVMEFTNLYRQQNGLPPLKWNDALGRAAQAHSLTMATTGILDHVINGVDPGARIKAQGYNPHWWGENVARAPIPLASPESFLELWINSPPHRENLLFPDFTEIGVGVREGNGSFYATQNFGRPHVR